MVIRECCQWDKNPVGFQLSQILFRYPGTTLIGSILIFGVLPLALLFIYPISIDSNPEKV